MKPGYTILQNLAILLNSLVMLHQNLGYIVIQPGYTIIKPGYIIIIIKKEIRVTVKCTVDHYKAAPGKWCTDSKRFVA